MADAVLKGRGEYPCPLPRGVLSRAASDAVGQWTESLIIGGEWIDRKESIVISGPAPRTSSILSHWTMFPIERGLGLQGLPLRFQLTN